MSKKSQVATTLSEVRRYFSVVRLPRVPNDFHQGYQIEIAELSGDVVVRRYRLDKVDTKQMTMAKLELINDPDTQEHEEFYKKHAVAT